MMTSSSSAIINSPEAAIFASFTPKAVVRSGEIV